MSHGLARAPCGRCDAHRLPASWAGRSSPHARPRRCRCPAPRCRSRPDAGLAGLESVQRPKLAAFAQDGFYGEALFDPDAALVHPCLVRCNGPTASSFKSSTSLAAGGLSTGWTLLDPLDGLDAGATEISRAGQEIIGERESASVRWRTTDGPPVFGNRPRISRIAGAKPMSNIWSASSNTAVPVSASVMTPEFI